VGSIVVYDAGAGYSEFGHVAKVVGLNANGTFDVQEMNFNAFNQVDVRTSTMADVKGFFVPPGSSIGSIAGSAASVLPGGAVIPLFGPAAGSAVSAAANASGVPGAIQAFGNQVTKDLQTGLYLMLAIFLFTVGLALLVLSSRNVREGIKTTAATAAAAA
jgi:hypothetical protein